MYRHLLFSEEKVFFRSSSKRFLPYIFADIWSNLNIIDYISLI